MNRIPYCRAWPLMSASFVLLLAACSPPQTPGPTADSPPMWVGDPLKPLPVHGPLLGAPAGLNVRVTLSADTAPYPVQVTATGTATHVITDDEAMAFGIDQSGLLKVGEAFLGQAPDGAVLHGPTPWGDLYSTYKWPEVHSTLTPANTQGESNVSVVTLAQRTLSNPGTQPLVVEAGLSVVGQNTVSSSWVGNMNSFSPGPALVRTVVWPQQSAPFSLTGTWGKTATSTQDVALGRAANVPVTLAPGQTATTTLTANTNTVQAVSHWNVTVDGVVAAYYADRFKDHYFWAFPLPTGMETAGLSPKQMISEHLMAQFFTGAVITVRDSAGVVLATVPVP